MTGLTFLAIDKYDGNSPIASKCGLGVNQGLTTMWIKVRQWKNIL